MDTFDPFKVPTLRALVKQIDRYDQEHAGDEAAKSVPGALFVFGELCGGDGWVVVGGYVYIYTYTYA